MVSKGGRTVDGDQIGYEDELIIASDLGELERVRQFIRRSCRCVNTTRFVSSRIHDIELAATEVVTNIIQHAYRGAGDQNIHIKIRMGRETLTLTMHDWGRPFDPGKVPLPDFDGSRSSGFGLFIIRKLVDELSFSRNEKGRNRTRLKIKMEKG